MVTESTLDQKRAEIARILGEDNVGVGNPKWLTMMEQGVIVELHIRRWRGRARLDLSDLGLPKNIEDDTYAHLMRLGDKKLLPAKEINGRKVSYVDLLDNLDSSTRDWLDRNSFETHWGRFVPFTKYEEWKKGNKEFERKYYELRDEIYSKYDNIKIQLRQEYGAMAIVAYRRVKALGKTSATEENFIEKFVGHVLSLVPSADIIKASFDYETTATYIPLPSEVERDMAKAKSIRLEQEVKDEAAMNKLQLLRRMNDDVVRQAKEKKEQLIDSFISDVARQVRSQIYDAVTDVLDSIKRNDGKLVGKSASQLAALMDKVASLNFYGDRDIDAMMAKVKATLGEVKDRNIDQVTGVLKDIGILTRASLIALGDNPRSARDVGIPVAPANGIVRQARAALGIVEVKAVELTRAGRK
ncbi:MAG: hypothetical protein PHI12_08315 [Dehalococcoidales bacterium]|nr:hypothetical protein [Dehalococcoidales bacterium]